MRTLRIFTLPLVLGALALLLWGGAAPKATPTTSTNTSAPSNSGQALPLSLSVLTFGADGTLYLGDSRGGAVFSLELEPQANVEPTALSVPDLEAKIAARLGTKAGDVMVHDLAVHPASNRIYLSVSRGRASWASPWQLPNHVADADLLLTLQPDGTLEEVKMDGTKLRRVALPNPISADKMHPWQEGLSLRTDTITDLAATKNTLFVAGLSNEEFASTMWRIPLPLGEGTVSSTTLEVYHGAHGAYETHAPIRTFVPYQLHGEDHLLAAYLCTPLSVFKVSDLETKPHVKGRTIAEFGAGNYPLDMVAIPGANGDRIALANSSLPLILVQAEDIAAYDGSITEEVTGYTAGVEHTKRSPSGIQQLDLLGNAFLVMLQRMPSGTLDLGTMPLRRG